MKPRLQDYFNDYAEAHRTRGNRWTHALGIPMIAFALLGLLNRLAFANVTMAQALLVFVAGFYLWLDTQLALGLIAVLIGFLFVAAHTPLVPLWVLFVVGWALQFVGHYHYEKKAPKFFQNLRHVLIGPLWIFAGIFVQRNKPSK